jgi:hypothetical protein
VRILGPASENEMIAVFLRAEVDSERYGGKLCALLARDGRAVELLREPDLSDAEDNRYRRGLLEEHRGYESRDALFDGFPHRVEWFRAAFTAHEVLAILYIDWDWWLTVSGGSRSPVDAARRIRAGEIAGVTADAGDEATAAAAATNPELIAVTTPAHSPLVLVEGHVRLTAYALFPASLPEKLEILLGVSDEIARWVQY